MIDQGLLEETDERPDPVGAEYSVVWVDQGEDAWGWHVLPGR